MSASIKWDCFLPCPPSVGRLDTSRGRIALSGGVRGGNVDGMLGLGTANLALGRQLTRKHVRFCKQSYDAAGIKEGFSGSFQGDGERGK